MIINEFVCLLGAGPWQTSISRLIREAGYGLLVVGPEPPSFPYERFLQADVRDTEKIWSRATSLGANILAFVSSQTDLTVPIVNELNRRLGIRHINQEVCSYFTDKYAQRIKNSLGKLPGHKVDAQNLLDFLTGIHLPAVSKPCSLQSSKGVKLWRNVSVSEVDEYLRELKSLEVETVVVEPFVSGTEITLEGYKRLGGTHEVLAISEKKKNIGFGVANSLLYQRSNLDKYRVVSGLLEDHFSVLDFGPTHTEVIVNSSGAFLVESAIRAGGTNIPSLIVPSLSGVYPEIDLLNDLGLRVGNPKKRIDGYEVVEMCFFRFLRGREDLRLDEIKERILFDWVSDSNLSEVTDDRSRHGCLILGSSCIQELDSIKKEFLTNNKNVCFYD